LAVYGYKDGVRKADSVLFYLADFRFPSSTHDYIVKDWQWVDLTSLGMVDSLEFNLFSSDTAGGFGINNPTYFCMDNLITNHHSFSDVHENFSEAIAVYPNPADDYIYIEPTNKTIINKLFIRDMYGKTLMYMENYNSKNCIDISNFAKGTYILTLDGISRKLVIR